MRRGPARRETNPDDSAEETQSGHSSSHTAGDGGTGAQRDLESHDPQHSNDVGNEGAHRPNGNGDGHFPRRVNRQNIDATPLVFASVTCRV